MSIRASLVLLCLSCSGGCSGEASPTGAPAVTPPSEIAARTSVRFELRGGGFAVTRGRSCRTFEIERATDGGFERVPLDLGVNCACECAMPGAPASIEYMPVSASAPRVIEWDGRQMVSVTRTVDCATRSFTTRGISSELVGALQPLPAGRYRVSVAVASAAPARCMELGAGYWCPPDSTAGVPGPGPYALCPGTRLSAEFDLPTEGSVTVPLGG